MAKSEIERFSSTKVSILTKTRVSLLSIIPHQHMSIIYPSIHPLPPPSNNTLRITFTTTIYVRHQLTLVPVTFHLHTYSPYIALLYHHHYTSIHVVQETCYTRVAYEFSSNILKSTYITHVRTNIYKHDVSSVLETERAELGGGRRSRIG